MKESGLSIAEYEYVFCSSVLKKMSILIYQPYALKLFIPIHSSINGNKQALTALNCHALSFRIQMIIVHHKAMCFHAGGTQSNNQNINSTRVQI